LVGGIVPGFVLAALYFLVIRVRIWMDPESAPNYPIPSIKASEKLRLVLINLVPMLGVIFLVTGVIVLGIATPSEASAFGVVGVVLLAALYRTLTWGSIIESVTGTVRVTSMVFMIILGSSAFSQILAFSGTSAGLTQWAVTLQVPSIVIVLAMMFVLLILGTLMESVSIMMLTVPVFFPLIEQLGF